MNNTYLEGINLNISKINLSDCFTKIINNNSIYYDLIYLQVKFFNNQFDIKYLLYDPKFDEILNLQICENDSITINKILNLTTDQKKTVLNAKDMGYNLLNINEKF